ncbi:hypothetical protein WJX75_008222 [Coccomyxa subellipsoidea]|uniref:Uncharacterized protein n=1 Tax=Coccomyxa subellipsoidea TaxID=248742 RepID=A0ABR2YCN4_9CHLO
MNSSSTNNSGAPTYQGPLKPGAASESIQPATVIIVLVACLFNALSILLVSRYLYIRFSRERENYAREQEAQRSRRHRTQESEPESSMQAAHLARFTPVLVMQPDSKVACAHKEVHPTDTVNGTGGSAAAAPPARQLQTMSLIRQRSSSSSSSSSRGGHRC